MESIIGNEVSGKLLFCRLVWLPAADDIEKSVLSDVWSLFCRVELVNEKVLCDVTWMFGMEIGEKISLLFLKLGSILFCLYLGLCKILSNASNASSVLTSGPKYDFRKELWSTGLNPIVASILNGFI